MGVWNFGFKQGNQNPNHTSKNPIKEFPVPHHKKDVVNKKVSERDVWHG